MFRWFQSLRGGPTNPWTCNRIDGPTSDKILALSDSIIELLKGCRSTSGNAARKDLNNAGLDAAIVTWESWRQIAPILAKCLPSKEDIALLSTLLDTFGSSFLEAFSQDNVTPYVHLLCSHLEVQLDRLKSMQLASQEKLELFHRVHKTLFYTATSHGGFGRSGVQDTLAEVWLRKITKAFGNNPEKFNGWLARKRDISRQHHPKLFL